MRPPAPAQAPARARCALAAAALVALALASFWPVLGNGFIGIDDPEYVTDNPRVLAGPTVPGIVWAFTSAHSSNWHPLTWISHMLDARLFGTEPAGHHAVSLLLHAANALLLFLLVRALTGRAGRSFVVAALFVAHPLRVESVAWIAERKDVLSACFGLSAMLAYLAWVRRPGRAGRALVALLFALGLLAKPMLVTLPLLLLLLDFWPLGRWRGAGRTAAAAGRLLAEKLPLLALAAAASVVTYRVQAAAGAVRSLEEFPLWVRAANAPLAAAAYLGKTLWPSGLATPYPHPGLGVDLPRALLAAALLAGVTAIAVALWRRLPAAATGWLWFLGSLVPVSGLVQTAGQGMADRYTYLPLIGPVLAAVWVAADRLRGPGRGRLAGAAACAVLLPLLAALSWRQSGFWRDDLALAGHAVAVDPGNWMARTNLGAALRPRGRVVEAIAQLEEALRGNPRYPDAHYNLAVALLHAGRPAEAVRHLEEAARRLPGDPDVRVNLGVGLARTGRLRESVQQFEIALRLRPGSAEAHNNLGVALEGLGRYPEAVRHYRSALAMQPGFREARDNLGAVLRRPASASRGARGGP